jgi:hypothetical protein
MKKVLFLCLIAVICIFSVLFFACEKKSAVSALQRENRFTLNYGSFEDEINLFSLSSAEEINTRIMMRDGLFYIANGEAQKVMQFNSYGNLLALCYNPDTNPAPVFETKQSENGASVITTQTAVRYPFNNPGITAVDSRKYLYVVDQLPSDRQQRDDVRQLLLAQVVLRFASDGKFSDYVGQQGLGGTPFPFIKDIFITKNDELVVVSQARTGMIVYWYSPTGFLMYTIPIEQQGLPNNAQTGDEIENYVSLKKIIPDFAEKKLYVAIDYYVSLIDEASKLQYGIEYNQSAVYTFDVEEGEFTNPVVIPPFEQTVDGELSSNVYHLAYDFLGQTESGWLFFILPDETGYMLQMIQQNGQRIQKRHLDVESGALVYYWFSLSPEGIISALLADEKTASVVWWRSDILLGSL